MKKTNNIKLRTHNEIAIQLKNVNKKYYIHHEKPTLAERIFNGQEEEFYALKKINLTIYKGEKVGIIGANGSGKTTLLKLITGISNPTSGKISTIGKVVSLIDLEAGFHPDLTGIQNIYLNGAILGLSKKQIRSRIAEIVDFADIGKFIDAPLFTYSSGMQLRIGFAVALFSEPDVLLLDENLSVGDEDFRMKSFRKIDEYIKSKKTIVMASHDLDVMENTCKRIYCLNRGEVVFEGKSKSVISRYRNLSPSKSNK